MNWFGKRQQLFKRLIVLLAAALVGLCFVFWPWNSVSDGPVIRVGLYENEPKIFSDEAGRPRGLFVELLTEIARQEGWQLQWVSCEWTQCLDQLESGDLQLMPDVAWSEERALRFDFHSLAVSQAWSQFYTSQVNNIPRSLEELAGQRIAVLRGAIQEAELQELLAEMDIPYTPVMATSQQDAFRLVGAGEADIAVANNFFGGRNSSVFQLVETPITFNQVSLYYTAARGESASLLNTIDRYLLDWRADPDSLYYLSLRQAITTPLQLMIPLWLKSTVLAGGALTLLLLLFVSILRWQVKQRTRQLQESGQRLQHLLDCSPVIIYSLRGSSLQSAWFSSNIERILGYKPRAALVQGWWVRHLHVEDRDEAIRVFNQIREKKHLRHEYRFLDANGNVRFLRDEMEFIAGDPSAGIEDEVVGSLTDVTVNYEQEERLSYLANYDHLTSLANRSQFTQRLSVMLREVPRKNQSVSLVFIDLDRFKNVNESLGSMLGDRVLLECAHRIANVCGPRDLVARVSADEFCLCLQHGPEENIENRLHRLLDKIREQIRVDGQPVILTASIGVSNYPRDGSNSEELMNMAEQAMYAAKARGGDCYYYYHSELQKNTFQRFQLENDLRRAIAGQQLQLHYQPQVNLLTGKLTGVEALVRWNHPKLGMIPPSQFIPIAEDTGIIFALDNWVLNEACRQLGEWDRQGLTVPTVSVNVTAAEIESETLLENVMAALDHSSLAPQRLEIEITESMIMRAPQQAIGLLKKLARFGVAIAMDDFGTGYSNLSYLGSLPLHRLKLDQSFVQEIGSNESHDAIIKTIILMAGSLNLSIIAEGIETEEQAHFLRQQGCHLGQGYYYARPQKAADIHELLSRLVAVPGGAAR